MSGATAVAVQLKKAFPGLRVTSVNRSRDEQDALVKAGKTRATNSQHLSDNGLDIVPPSGVAPDQIRRWLSDNGHNPGEFLVETGKGENQGTGAHIHIGLAPKGGDPASAGGGSSYDQALARQRASQPSDIASMYEAYRNTGKEGGMTPQDATQFEHAVEAGQIILPRGGSIRAKASVAELPKGLVEAFNSHAMDDDPEARQRIEDAVKAGEVAVPRGMTLKAPAPRTFAERLGIGARGLLTGAGGLADLVATPLNRGINLATGAGLSDTPGRDIGNAAADAMGLGRPESPTENLANSINEGGTQGLLTAGLGGLASGAEGVTGAVGKALASSPAIDTLSGATSGVASETARQAGAGPVGQFAAGLAGGLVPVGAAGAIERAATRAPRTLPEVTAETPRAAIIDDAGELTPHGQEVAARHNATPEDVRRAYEVPPDAQAGVANDTIPPAIAREATNDVPIVAQAAEREPVAAKVGEASADAAQNVDASPDVPALPGQAAARVAAAQDFGVDMTRGQATKSFDIQDAEKRLQNSNGSEAEQMRQFVARQQEQVKAAADRFQSAFDEKVPADIRGEQIREALSELRDLGQKGVSELYAKARELGAPVDLDTTKIRNSFEGLMAEADIPEPVKKVMEQEAARYGLIGEPVVVDKASGSVTNEANVTTVKLDDGQTIKFRGEPQTLRLDNAEDFRKVISKQYAVDGPQKLSQELKRVIDDTVEETATKLASGGKGKISEAMAAARKAHIEQKTTFGNKDMVQDIIDWKRGSSTTKLSPEQVMARALGKESDLKKIKAVLLTKPTVKSQAAWRGIQAHGLAELFQKATTTTSNVGGEALQTISGLKLRSAIDTFPPSKLKTLLDPDDFNKLMKLKRVIEDVTIPINGTVNHSNSGNLLMRIMGDVDNKVTAAFAAGGFAVGGPVGGAIGGGIGRTISPAIKASKEAAAARETLSGATEYTPAKAAADTGERAPGAVSKAAGAAKNAATKTVQQFIEIYSSPRVIAPVLAASSGEET